MKFKRKLFHPSMSPMDFICMDLIGEFHPPTRHGHCSVLTACLYAYWVHMVHTIKDKDNSRGSDSKQEPHLLHLWRKCENPHRQGSRTNSSRKLSRN